MSLSIRENNIITSVCQFFEKLHQDLERNPLLKRQWQIFKLLLKIDQISDYKRLLDFANCVGNPSKETRFVLNNDLAQFLPTLSAGKMGKFHNYMKATAEVEKSFQPPNVAEADQGKEFISPRRKSDPKKEGGSNNPRVNSNSYQKSEAQGEAEESQDAIGKGDKYFRKKTYSVTNAKELIRSPDTGNISRSVKPANVEDNTQGELDSSARKSVSDALLQDFNVNASSGVFLKNQRSGRAAEEKSAAEGASNGNSSANHITESGEFNQTRQSNGQSQESSRKEQLHSKETNESEASYREYSTPQRNTSHEELNGADFNDSQQYVRSREKVNGGETYRARNNERINKDLTPPPREIRVEGSSSINRSKGKKVSNALNDTLNKFMFSGEQTGQQQNIKSLHSPELESEKKKLQNISQEKLVWGVKQFLLDMQNNSNKLDQIVKPLKTIDLSGGNNAQENEAQEESNQANNNNNPPPDNRGFNNSNQNNNVPPGNPAGFPFFNKFPQNQAPMYPHPPFQYPQYHPHPPGMPPFIRGNLFMPF